jgi:hypothetical protein
LGRGHFSTWNHSVFGRFGKWVRDRILDSELFDGLLEDVSEAEAAKLIALQLEHEKIAA